MFPGFVFGAPIPLARVCFGLLEGVRDLVKGGHVTVPVMDDFALKFFTWRVLPLVRARSRVLHYREFPLTGQLPGQFTGNTGALGGFPGKSRVIAVGAAPQAACGPDGRVNRGPQGV